MSKLYSGWKNNPPLKENKYEKHAPKDMMMKKEIRNQVRNNLKVGKILKQKLVAKVCD